MTAGRSQGVRRTRRAAFVGMAVVIALWPLAGLVARWADGDEDGIYRYSWQMYSNLDKYRGN